MQKKKLHINTIGCQMNVYDSELIANALKPLGYAETSGLKNADLIIVNTCAIREKAEQKVFSFLGRLAGLKRKKPGIIIAVGGCVAQQEGKKLLLNIPYVNFVFGTHNLHKLPELIKTSKGKERKVEIDLYKEILSLDFPGYLEERKVISFITIMQGCNNYCSYCIVP